MLVSRDPHLWHDRSWRVPAVTVEGNAPEPPTAPSADHASGPPGDGAVSGPPGGGTRRSRHVTREQVAQFIQAVRNSDQATVNEMVLRLSRARPWLAPLAFAVGAFAMLFEGVKLLFTNWRLTLIQVLPAMWIWAAMYDLKLHVQPVTRLHLVHGKPLHVLEGPEVVIPVVLGVAVVTAASFYLNAVFAFAIIQPGRPQIRPAFTEARKHLPIVLGSGFVIGILLGVSAVVVGRWGLFWFALSLGIVVGIMMVCYVAVPSRLIGMKTTFSKRDKLAASVVGGAVGAVICTPPYALGRVGLLMLGSRTAAIFALGVVFFAVGLTLQAGATGAVKTVKMSAKLVSSRNFSDGDASPASSPVADEAQGP
jgi:hypothetical protein